MLETRLPTHLPIIWAHLPTRTVESRLYHPPPPARSLIPPPPPPPLPPPPPPPLRQGRHPTPPPPPRKGGKVSAGPTGRPRQFLASSDLKTHGRPSENVQKLLFSGKNLNGPRPPQRNFEGKVRKFWTF